MKRPKKKKGKEICFGEFHSGKLHFKSFYGLLVISCHIKLISVGGITITRSNLSQIDLIFWHLVLGSNFVTERRFSGGCAINYCTVVDNAISQ